MDDPRWQRAMERLGLDHEPTFLRYAHPDDPATFLRVVEALWLHGWFLEICYKATAISDGGDKLAPFFYEAVMEAFGQNAEQE